MARKPSSPPSFVVQWRTALRETDLSGIVRAVGKSVSEHMFADGTGAFPGTQLIVRESGFSRSSVLRALKVLEETGWLVVVVRGRAPRKGEKKLANEYRANIPTGVTETPVHQTTGVTETPVTGVTETPVGDDDWCHGDTPTGVTETPQVVPPGRPPRAPRAPGGAAGAARPMPRGINNHSNGLARGRRKPKLLDEHSTEEDILNDGR